ncbi:MAG: DUF86 domain-containing protein [Nitrospirae bacterium]|nr:DUF86 domain-containing protein [Nitrospirota bacterium]
MLDKDRIAKNKTDILNIKSQIDELIACDKESFLSDKRNSLSLKYLLIEGVEAIADLCQHILAKTKGLACDGYIDCIIKAGDNGIIKPVLANKLRRLADLRNSLIHRYWIINDDELFSACRENIDDSTILQRKLIILLQTMLPRNKMIFKERLLHLEYIFFS